MCVFLNKAGPWGQQTANCQATSQNMWYRSNYFGFEYCTFLSGGNSLIWNETNDNGEGLSM